MSTGQVTTEQPATGQATTEQVATEQAATERAESAPLPTLLRVEHGSPTAEELAALTLLLAALAGGSGESAPPRPHSFGWGSGRRLMRRPHLRDRAWGGW